jgi:hypothetical protein
MDAVVEPDLHGLRILIVESDVQLLRDLQTALDEEGAGTLVVTDPHSFAGAERITRFIFDAALINDWYRGTESSLQKLPVVLYGRAAPVPAQADIIVGELRRALSAHQATPSSIFGAHLTRTQPLHPSH